MVCCLHSTGSQSLRWTTDTAQNQGAKGPCRETSRNSSLILQLRKLRQKVSWGGCYLTPLHLFSSLLSSSSPLSYRDLQSLLGCAQARSPGVDGAALGCPGRWPCGTQVPLPRQLRLGPTISFFLAPVRAASQKAQDAPRSPERRGAWHV